MVFVLDTSGSMRGKRMTQAQNAMGMRTGDMGVMSGLIATNSKELEALRRLGDRDYFEFVLPKSSAPHGLIL